MGCVTPTKFLDARMNRLASMTTRPPRKTTHAPTSRGLVRPAKWGLILTNDADADGICDADEVPGCTDGRLCNYNEAATDEDNSCTFVDGICETCVDNHCLRMEMGFAMPTKHRGLIQRPATDCTDTDNSLCVYADEVCEVCLGGAVVLFDLDGDGVSDADEIAGCTDEAACNYNLRPRMRTDHALDLDTACAEASLQRES